MGKRATYDPADYVSKVDWHTQDASIGAVLKSEVSRRFHDLMTAAMLTSFYKYGALADGYPERVHAVESLQLRLLKYAETGNAEYLVDVANFAMIEFMHPAHPDATFTATDASGSPGRVAANAAIYDQPVPYRNTDLADQSDKPL